MAESLLKEKQFRLMNRYHCGSVFAENCFIASLYMSPPPNDNSFSYQVGAKKCVWCMDDNFGTWAMVNGVY